MEHIPSTVARHPRGWRSLALFLGGATLVGLFFASRTYILYNSYPDNSITWGEAALPALTDWYVWAVLAVVVFEVTRRFPVDRRDWMRHLPVHLIAGAAVSLIKIVADLGAAELLPWISTGPPLTRRVFFSFHPNLMTYAVIAGLAHALLYYRRYRERELRASQLETQLARARLEVLEMQLHPHFLFNTLHAINTLMHRDVEAAERMVTRLSDLLRLTLETRRVQEVRLEEELSFLGRYLEIEQIRFGDRLAIEVDIDTSVLDVHVPTLILQPLVENAIRHGVARRAGPGRVEVIGRRQDGFLELTVRDNGPGVPDGAAGAPETGVGLSNTKARLQALYGDAHGFELATEPGRGFAVRLAIPLHSASDGDGGGSPAPEPVSLS